MVEQVEAGTPSGGGMGASSRPTARWGDAPLPVVLAVWIVICLVTITAGVSIGSVHIPVAQVWRVIADHLTGQAHLSVAAVVGAGLATAGAVVQALVRRSGRLEPVGQSVPAPLAPPACRPTPQRLGRTCRRALRAEWRD